jgi:Cd2+/Zn2+-exporting ATPase
MNVLMTVAVTGAWLVGEGAEGAAVVFLFALSELLESWSVGRARRAIAALLKLTPQTALDAMEPMAVDQRSACDRSRLWARRSACAAAAASRSMVKSSPADSAVNQAPITGESVPVEKKPGDPVFAGTINGEGSLTVRVTKAASDSTLARIIKLVEEAEEQKAPTQRFVDKFATIYTPAVFIVALLVALLPPLLMGGAWSEWTYRALVLLVIACPCALVIATPVSIVSGLTALARRGVLIKGGAYLEAVGKLRALAVDKTGTITQGRPHVTGIIPLGILTEEASHAPCRRHRHPFRASAGKGRGGGRAGAKGITPGTRHGLSLRHRTRCQRRHRRSSALHRQSQAGARTRRLLARDRGTSHRNRKPWGIPRHPRPHAA